MKIDSAEITKRYREHLHHITSSSSPYISKAEALCILKIEIEKMQKESQENLKPVEHMTDDEKNQAVKNIRKQTKLKF